MSDDSADLDIESVERVEEGFELTRQEDGDSVTVECVTTDIDVDAIADAVAGLDDEYGLDDGAVTDIEAASRSYNEIRPDIEALFSELADDGLIPFLGDSTLDVETIRRWRREHPEAVDRLDAVVDEYRTVYRKLHDATPIVAAENDFFDVYPELAVICQLIEDSVDE